MLEGPEELVDRPGPERIPTVGAVERDPDRLPVVGTVVGDVGQVLEAVEASGKAEDTLIFFLSDNGGTDKNGSINAPLRG